MEPVGLGLAPPAPHLVAPAVAAPDTLAAGEVVDLELALVVAAEVSVADLLVHRDLGGGERCHARTLSGDRPAALRKAPHHAQGGAMRSQHLPVFGNQDLLPQHVLEGSHDALVQ